MPARHNFVRLPDEFEFASVNILTDQVPARAMAGKSQIGEVEDVRRLVPLTGDEYFRLCEIDGRSLHCWVTELFGLRRGKPRFNDGRLAA